LTPSVFAPAGAAQPVIQYGCRVIPIASLATPALSVDASSTPIVLASSTENDLYTGSNEGPAACTYDAASSTGMLMGRKYERDPVNGFIVTQVATRLKP
jgi:hypothetical protein